MNLSVSDVFWPKNDSSFLKEVAALGINQVELSAGHFRDFLSDGFFDSLSEALDEYDLDISSLICLFHGLKGSICWDRGDVFLEHFSSYIEWIRRFEPISLVFDDPNLRRRGSLNMNESLDCAADWLRRLSVIMEGLPTHLCVKPSPAVYKGEFAFSHTQTFDLVRKVKARRVAVSLDTGAMQINGESPEAVLSALMGCFYHVTICDPGFRPLGKDSDLTFHRHVARSLLASDYPGEITLCFKPEGSLHDSLARSVDFVRDVYFGDNFRKRPSKGNGRSR